MKADFRTRRTRLGFSQKDIASRLGISQVAVSKFENGDTSAISSKKAREYYRMLGVPEEERNLSIGVCGNVDCPAGHTVVIGGVVRIKPIFFSLARGLSHCIHCGQKLLIDGCKSCGSELISGATFCGKCGEPYVDTSDFELLEDSVDFSRGRNRIRSEYLDFNATPILVNPRTEN